MELNFLDWSIVIFMLALTLFIGIKFKNKASSSLADFFVGGRSFPWYLAGLSMVATTFAADTPLAVTEIIRKDGISGNWVWWNMAISGMLTTFFFARLWRRANVLTELEFLELRYKGIYARILVAFKSVYLGVIMNAIVIGWVNYALMQILIVFFGIPESTCYYVIFGAMLFAAFYSSLSGIWGVAITDVIQFGVAMTGCIILAYYVLDNEQVGGIEGLKAALPEGTMDFLPQLGVKEGIHGFSISIITFISFVGIQWWASWFPGAEPGGGGYIAQRIMSTKNEDHAVYSSLFFNIAHYCLRPWPWIIVGLGTIILYPVSPDVNDGQTFVMAIKDLLPSGLKGLLFASFIAAYLSTISTQLNWGASFLTNDLFKRFIHQPKEGEDVQKTYLKAGRINTLIIMLVAFSITPFIESVASTWKFLLGCGAGLGMVLILRWFWWRINAITELVATFAPFIYFFICSFWLEDLLGESFIENNGSFLTTAFLTTITWLIVAFSSKPEEINTLRTFYEQVRPLKRWNIKTKGETITLTTNDALSVKWLALSWVSAVLVTYSALFLIGKIIFGEYIEAFQLAGLTLIFFGLLKWSMRRSKVFAVN